MSSRLDVTDLLLDRVAHAEQTRVQVAAIEARRASLRRRWSLGVFRRRSNHLENTASELLATVSDDA